VAAALEELHWDAAGLASLHEAEVLASRVREIREAARRGRERDLQAWYQLEPSVFAEFRSQLLGLHAAFVALDEDASGALDAEEVKDALFEIGCVAQDSGKFGGKRSEELVRYVLADTGGGEVSFQDFLGMVRQLRALGRQSKEEAVRGLFRAHDHNASGALDMREICRVLAALGVQPRTPREQEEIAQLMEEVDADGSGQISIEELLTMVQRIDEQFMRLQREEENKVAEALQFSRKQANALRHVFEAMDRDGDCVIRASELGRAMQVMGYSLSPYKLKRLLQQADSDTSGALSFPEFLGLMRRIMDAEPPLSSASGVRREVQALGRHAC